MEKVIYSAPIEELEEVSVFLYDLEMSGIEIPESLIKLRHRLALTVKNHYIVPSPRKPVVFPFFLNL